MHIHQAIIPAAGLGTRFLPFTKATPKELLPLLNRSAIEYIIQEGVASGITDFYMITNGDKTTLAKYFQQAPVLEQFLVEKKSEYLLESVNALMAQSYVHYIKQDKPLGLGHAVLQARLEMGNNYFGVFLPDDILVPTMVTGMAALAQLIQVARAYRASVIAVQEVPSDHVSNYGIVAIKQEIAPGVVELNGLVEKPSAQDAPSRLAIIGRYVLCPQIFTSLEVTPRGAGNEIQLTDALNHMVRLGERVVACVVQSTRYDIGTPLGWLSANIDLGLQIPEYASAIKKIVQQR